MHVLLTMKVQRGVALRLKGEHPHVESGQRVVLDESGLCRHAVHTGCVACSAAILSNDLTIMTILVSDRIDSRDRVITWRKVR